MWDVQSGCQWAGVVSVPTGGSPDMLRPEAGYGPPALPSDQRVCCGEGTLWLLDNWAQVVSCWYSRDLSSGSFTSGPSCSPSSAPAPLWLPVASLDHRSLPGGLGCVWGR